jgi:hypothetical protein
MPLKRSTAPVEAETTGQNGNGSEPFEVKENPRVNAQIDGYIKANPKQWAFIKSLPRERLERAVVWEKIRHNEQQQKLNGGLFNKIEQNPALKKDYDALMKHVPENERERVSIQIARTLVFSQSRGQRQSANAVGA